MEFHNKAFLLIAIPAFIALAIAFQIRSKGRLRFSSLFGIKQIGASPGIRNSKIVPLLRFLVIALLVLAFSGPRLGVSGTEKFPYAADVIIVVDTSTSMGQQDYDDSSGFITRIEGTKKVLAEFLSERNNNRVGIIAFAKNAYTLCPLTLDYEMLEEIAANIHLVETEEEDGTAIGLALANAVDRLAKSEVASKAIILLTDGENNWGWLSPENAAQLASAEGISVYTIGVASYSDEFDTNVDDELLREISRITGGRYYRAQDVRTMERVYGTIDDLKLAEIARAGYGKYYQLSPILVLAALGLYFIEMILKNTIFLKIP